jgi:hypothetical protein
MWSMSFLNYLILPAVLGPGFIESLTEMSIRSRGEKYVGSRARPARKARLTAIHGPIV